MKKSLLLGAAFALAMSMNAQTTVTWVAAEALKSMEAGTGEANMVPSIDFGDVTCTLWGEKAAKSPNVAPLNNLKDDPGYERVLRVYFGNTLTFKGNSEDVKITKIEFTNSSDALTHENTISALPLVPYPFEIDGANYGCEIVSGGGSIAYGTPTSTWTGDTNEFVIRPNSGTSKQVRFAKIAVTYTGGAGVNDIVMDENAPVEYFNMQGVKVANPENGIYIKRQGSKVTKAIVK